MNVSKLRALVGTAFPGAVNASENSSLINSHTEACLNGLFPDLHVPRFKPQSICDAVMAPAECL